MSADSSSINILRIFLTRGFSGTNVVQVQMLFQVSLRQFCGFDLFECSSSLNMLKYIDVNQQCSMLPRAVNIILIRCTVRLFLSVFLILIFRATNNYYYCTPRFLPASDDSSIEMSADAADTCE